MPIKNRPTFLILTQLKSNTLDTTAQSKSTQKHLNSNFETLRRQMRSEPASDFKEAPYAPNYCAMRQSGFFERHNDFMLNNSGEDVFIHARREPAQCAGTFDGDKLHISIEREDVPRAFNTLTGLLFSEDSPIDNWKITDLERAEPASRISEGAQFTLYVKPDVADSQYTAQGLNRVRYFVERLESTLIENNIHPGQHPDSDIRPSSWQYISYRNELRSHREGSEVQNHMLSNEPFYRLITE